MAPLGIMKRSVVVKDRAMDETKNLSETEGSQALVRGFERVHVRRSHEDRALPDHPPSGSGRVRTGLSRPRR